MAVAKIQGRSKEGLSLSLSLNTDLPKRYNTVCPRPESCDAPRALMSVTPNLCCDETKNRGTYTRVTSMVPCLRYNMAETTSVWKRPSTAGAQLSNAPMLEAEGEETQCRGRPIVLETGTAKNELSRKLMQPSLKFQKTSG